MQRKILGSKHNDIGERLENVCVVILGSKVVTTVVTENLHSPKKKALIYVGYLAAEVGFEPTERVNVRRLCK